MGRIDRMGYQTYGDHLPETEERIIKLDDALEALTSEAMELQTARKELHSDLAAYFPMLHPEQRSELEELLQDFYKKRLRENRQEWERLLAELESMGLFR